MINIKETNKKLMFIFLTIYFSVPCFTALATGEDAPTLGSPNPYYEQQGDESSSAEESVIINAKSDRYEFCSSAAYAVNMFIVQANALETFDSKNEIFSSLAESQGIDYPFLSVRGDAETFVIQKAIVEAWDNRGTHEKNIDSVTHPSQKFWRRCLSFSLDVFKQTWLDADECDDNCDD